jgi:4-hydroxy-3-methylbut-2-enyl diphosphate reductase
MMPKIIIARSAGFCFGVRRAIDLAEKTVRRRRRVYTLGPLIHNPQEVRRLSANGIRAIKDPARLKGATLILRTHGIPAPLMEKLRRQKITIVDATCPFVKRAQDIVKRLSADGRQPLIVGETTHPEVVALVSYGGDRCAVVENKAAMKGIRMDARVGIVSQTTQTPENFRQVLAQVRRRCPAVQVYNTICRATMDRQAEARALARKVDCLFVVGGKNSGNTRRLAEIGGRFTKTYAIETASEIRPRWLRGAARIGITAGASTPDWIIHDVKDKIISIAG